MSESQKGIDMWLGLLVSGFSLLLLVGLTACCQTNSTAFPEPESALGGGNWAVGEVLYEEEFNGNLDRWRPELEKGGKVAAEAGGLVIDVPGGCTVWFEPELEGPVVVEYYATVVGEGGGNDRVSDLNCFWMARDARGMEHIFDVERSGQFADYNQLRCYYVGYGGNSNTTTRFRRYIGDAERRPLKPGHDLSAERFMIEPNRRMRIRCVAANGAIEYWRDGEQIFALQDDDPYTSGWFGLRTVTSHLKIDSFKIYRLVPIQ